MEKNHLQLDNVRLRPINDSDAFFLMELNNDDEISRYVVGTPRKVTYEEQLQWMESIKNETRTKRFIVEREEESVGTVIISNIDLFNMTANINIKLKGTMRGQGIGKKAVKIALAICFEQMSLYCLTAHILPFNLASIALFESCGFLREGVLRSRVVKEGLRYDLLSFSLTRDEQ